MGDCRSIMAVLLAAAVVVLAPAHAMEPALAAKGCGPSAQIDASAGSAGVSAGFRYDAEYPSIRYADVAVTNPVARLQERMATGEAKLVYRAHRGYLDSLLASLGIDASSQLLVYSKSSVQRQFISPDKPRAIYFNDEVYVGWVQGSDQLELATMDCEKGPVFYVFDNRPDADVHVRREMSRCLSCHDAAGMLGGGVPTLTAYSMPVDRFGFLFPNDDPVAVTDATPVERRWAGWYVTGTHGRQTHLGNLLVNTPEEFRNADLARNGNRESVAGLLDSRAYMTDKSDIVALMVFEHQAALQSLLSRALFKSSEFLTRNLEGTGIDRSFDELPPRVQALLRRLLEPVVRALLFADAAGLKERMQGSAGFESWFSAQGPRDGRGRSLREFDLQTRIFRYPLSYLIYSESFDGLPRSAQEYVYARLQQILSRTEADEFPNLSLADRRAILEIMEDTKPDFMRGAAAALAEKGVLRSTSSLPGG